MEIKSVIQQADICVGLQHGDEGKGKVSYNLTKKIIMIYVLDLMEDLMPDIVSISNGLKIILHQIPCGIIHNIPCVIGPYDVLLI